MSRNDPANSSNIWLDGVGEDRHLIKYFYYKPRNPENFLSTNARCYFGGIDDMNGKFLCPLTGLNDFNILGAAPIIREKNKRAAT